MMDTGVVLNRPTRQHYWPTLSDSNACPFGANSYADSGETFDDPAPSAFVNMSACSVASFACM